MWLSVVTWHLQHYGMKVLFFHSIKRLSFIEEHKPPENKMMIEDKKFEVVEEEGMDFVEKEKRILVE